MWRTSVLGKADKGYLRSVVYRRLGAKRSGILVGPKFGVDNSVVRIGNGNVLVATSDPISLIPELGAADSAWLSVNLLASDLTTSGFSPQYGILDFNLPPTMKDSEFAKYWRAFHRECKMLGVAIIGGHTGRYQGCDYTIIGGGVLYAIGPENRYLTSAMANAADDLILTKGAAIETTAILTRVFPRRVRKTIGERLFEKGRRYLHLVSTTKDALTAVSVGVHEDGVTAMHDATEGGVLSAILEVADASGLGLELDLDRIMISEETEQICRLFEIDPLTSLSEGSLIMASRPQKSSRILRRLRSQGIPAEIVGRLTDKTRSRHAIGRRGRIRLQYPRFDPYWKAYWRAVRRGWN